MSRDRLPIGDESAAATPALARRHLRFGWWSLFAFAALGLTLEALHGFKAGAYLDVANDTRRLMWTLAHAHGVLLGAVNVLFGLTLAVVPASGPGPVLTSRCLMAAGLLLPAGFFLGGLVFHAGDPGLGIVLVPVGAVLLLVGLVRIARNLHRTGVAPADGTPKPGRR